MTMGRQRGPRGRSRDRTRDVGDREQDAITETVVNIRRVAKTVAGGRRFTFNALVVVGDGEGRIGFGLGKASEVPDAVQKGSAIARRAMLTVALVENTVPQQIVSRFGGAQVLLKPAAPGTGVRASAAVRAVVQAAGVRDILTKSQGSSNPINVVQATIRGMQMMRAPADIIALRRMVRGEPPLPPAVDDADHTPTGEGSEQTPPSAAPSGTQAEATTAAGSAPSAQEKPAVASGAADATEIVAAKADADDAPVASEDAIEAPVAEHLPAPGSADISNAPPAGGEETAGTETNAGVEQEGAE